MQTPSRQTAEAGLQQARAVLMRQVSANGCYSGYSGVRIAADGQRFRMLDATIWNLYDTAGVYCGQAASFAGWQIGSRRCLKIHDQPHSAIAYPPVAGFGRRWHEHLPDLPHMHRFVPGQRWISDTETELGLGQVAEVDFRLVKIEFPASKRNPCLRQNNAPLTRVIFTRRCSRHPPRLEAAGYRCERGRRPADLHRQARWQTGTLPETDLDHHLQFNQPQQRLFAGQIDSDDWLHLRVEALQHLQNWNNRR